ncbi:MULTISPECIES: nitroreductase family protein [unclassified Streptomyces]|uniref:nitroreductase family protein n=1 Tax=unclassified Streptomyces TaxID=2593676 RepID=UPI001F1DFDBB|nr:MULTISPECIES: nitroreductase family protein [unclassified Streptomyces]
MTSAAHHGRHQCRGIALPSTASPLTDIVRARRSVRKFLPAPLSPSDIRGVLEDAQTAPSNCNTQPSPVPRGTP